MHEETRSWHSGAEARTVSDLLILRSQKTPDLPAYRFKHKDAWISRTWKEFFLASAAVARGLIDLDLAVGDRVAVLGPTGPLWAHQDFGGLMAGLVTLGIYPHQTVDQIAYLLDHSEARIVFVAEADELETLLAAARENQSLKAIVPWTGELFKQFQGRDPRLLDPAHFEEKPLEYQQLQQRLALVHEDDTAILIYTSGTTGPPKGAMISHRNIVKMVQSLREIDDFGPGDSLLCFLPMAHVTQRVMAFFNMVSQGVECAYASNMGAVLQELGEVRPTIFGSVPRLFEKAYNKIQDEMSHKSPAVQKLFHWACRVGIQRIRLLHQGRPVGLMLRAQVAIADKLVFSKIRKAFGGRVRVCLTGAAPIAIDILELFWAADLSVFEAYGMTEATVVTHINRPGQVRLGSVGRPVRGVTHKIAEDGEILIKGETVFRGYFKNQQATAETIIDGWLHTGDIGEIDEEGYLRITDRKKHLIVTAGGKNVAPANIERAIKNQSPLISHVHAHGDRRPYISAIIAPSPLETLDWGLARGCLTPQHLDLLRKELLANPAARSPELNTTMAKVVAHPDFARTLIEPVRLGNQRLARVERVRRFRVLERDFSQENDELTPTMKLKRKMVESNYAQIFDRLYSDPDFGIEVEPAGD